MPIGAVPPRSQPPPSSPLKPHCFLVLLAVAEAPVHGYAIKKDLERRGERLDPGSLYRLIARMLDEGLIREADDPSGDTDPRRRCYGITPSGRRALLAEANRMSALIDHVRALSLVPGRRRS
jgi:DNA-binding PadR family transcriptional regulator